MRHVKTINLSLTPELLTQIDRFAGALYSTRSEYIRHAVIEQMRIDSGNEDLRRTMAKQLPTKFIVRSDTEEFAISPDYID